MPESRGKCVRVLAMLGGAALAAFAVTAATEPGTGIAVNGSGAVFFADTQGGPWKIGANGRVAAHDGPPLPFMAIDPDGRFAGVPLPANSTAQMKHAGGRPMLILSSVPIAIAGDRALYFPETGKDGRLQIVRLLPSGTHDVLATLPATTEDGPLQRVNGIAAGPEDSVYYTENKAVRKITKEGTISTLASSVMVPDCARPPGYEEKSGPRLRGIVVASDGTAFVAATGCSVVISVSGQGAVTPLLRAVSPWSPTGVALGDTDLYVLEYLHDVSGDPRNWLPRVRKRSQDGRISLLAEVRGRRKKP
jgi:hypothetical protein